MAFAVFGCAFSEKGLCHYLCDDGTYFAHCGAESVACATVTGWETFAGDDEGGGIRAEVEEELGHDVERKESIG